MKLAALLTPLLFATSVLAQPVQGQGAPPSPIGAAQLCNSCYEPLSVTTTSAAISIPAAAPPYGAITLINTGLVDAYIAQGNSSVVATLANPVLRAGKSMTVLIGNDGGAGYVAAITASGSTSIDIYQTNAWIGLQSSVSGGGGGGTGNQGSPNAGGPSNAWFVQGCSSCAPAPISAASLPLANNAAQETGGNLAGINTSASSIATSSSSTATSSSATATNTAALSSSSGATATNTNNTAVSSATTATNTGTIVTNTGNTATSVATIATNSATQATAANQSTGNNSLSTIATNTGTTATNTGSTTTNTATTATNTGTTATNTTTLTNSVANPGTTPSKATAVQGCTGCTPVTVAATSSSWTFSAAPTLATSSHAANTCLGAQFTISSYAGLSNIEITDKGTNFAGQTIGVYISTSALGTPCTDGAAFTLASGDLANIPAGLKGLVYVPNPSGGWTTFSNQNRSNLSVWLTGPYPVQLFVNVVLGSGPVTPSTGELLIQGNGPV